METRAVTHQDLPPLFDLLEQTFAARREELCALDAVAGDGDLGISLHEGFAAAAVALRERPPADVGEALKSAAMAFNRASPSTLGTLVATALLRAGGAASPGATVALPDAARLLEAASEGIRSRGRAAPGDKTILDALEPASVALRQAEREGRGCRAAFRRALEAAREGAEATRAMVPKAGRARWLEGRSLGTLDGGAVALALMLETVCAYLEPDKGD